MAETTDRPSVALKASYKSPSETQTFDHKIQAAQNGEGGSVEATEKQRYFSELRASTKTLQTEINAFLTDQMERDKKQATQPGTNGSAGRTQEDVEEDNYGEEASEDGP